MNEPFGSATLIRDGDRIIVEHADPTIGVSIELWHNAAGTVHRPDDHTLILDSDGEYRYRLRGEHTDGLGNRWLIFDREEAS